MRRGLRAIVGSSLAAALAILAGPAPAAGQESDALYVRVGALRGATLDDLDSGIEFGAGWDWHKSPTFTIGAGSGFARQGKNPGLSEFDAHVLSFELHGRAAIGGARIRPLAELGLGYYLFHRHTKWSGMGETILTDEGWNAPGVWLGIGTEVRITQNVGARLGFAYHFFSRSLALETLTTEDYLASGLTLDLGLPR